jgi:hypothetical protein
VVSEMRYFMWLLGRKSYFCRIHLNLMRLKSIFFLSSLIVLIISSCKKSGTSSEPDKPKVYDVYVTGSTTVGGKKIATYWKNGIETKLSNDMSNTVAIAAKGSDTYIIGSIVDKWTYTTVYWKNGQLVKFADNNPIPTTLGEPKSISVDGDNIYIMGPSNVYWKNDIPSSVINSGFGINSFAVKNGSFYFTGPFSLDWKYFANGTTTTLSNIRDIAKVAFYNNDFYMVGTAVNIGVNGSDVVYWKNGIMQAADSAPKTFISYGKSIAANDKGVHVVGQIQGDGGYHAAYWLNGNATRLATSATDNRVNAFDIFLQDQDIYVAGQLNGHACYWKNGTLVTLNSESGVSQANGIVLAPR